ncbi:MAG: methionyl-tRNA formyltransferase [Sphingobacteriales bacterium]|jgi:methionyl-tRNA formyltransferase
MNFAFVTCVQIGLSCIEKVYDTGGGFKLFITLKDEKAKKKSGRIYLDELASEKNVPLLKINHINDREVIEALREHEIDWLFIIGWSQIAGKEVIETPKKGAIGAHPTLLPVGRGRAAIPWAIIKGHDKTGVSFFVMDEGVDTGPLLGQEVLQIGAKETAQTLYDRVNTAHEDLIGNIWTDLKNDIIVPQVQDDSKATYWEGRKPEDGELKLSDDINYVDRLVRATTKPYPGAFILINGRKLIIWEGEICEKPSDNENSKVLKFKNGFYSIITSEFA